MFITSYHFLWTALLILLSPFVFLFRNKKKIRRLIPELPDIVLDDGNIWIHALSVGEVISAVPLVSAVKARYPDKDIVFSVSTEKGMEIALKELEQKVRVIITMPLDFWWSYTRVVKFIKPSVFIIIETDVWPGLVSYLRNCGIKSLLVNGRVSPRTYRSYRLFSFLVREMFSPLEACLMQTDLDRDRLVNSGIVPAYRAVTTGNIKFDREWKNLDEKEKAGWLDILGLKPDDPVWVAGSTHHGEEKIILDVFVRLLKKYKELRLIIAPRNIAQSGDILETGVSMGLHVSLRSGLGDKMASYWNVMILDTVGELGRVYGLSRISFVGGTMVPAGGHNLLEPAWFGCPVVYGCHTSNFVQMAELLCETGGGIRVRDNGDLYTVMTKLLENDGLRMEMGMSARKFVEENQGALEKLMARLGEIL